MSELPLLSFWNMPPQADLSSRPELQHTLNTAGQSCSDLLARASSSVHTPEMLYYICICSMSADHVFPGTHRSCAHVGFESRLSSKGGIVKELLPRVQQARHTMEYGWSMTWLLFVILWCSRDFEHISAHSLV